ncbi:hypothetical protein [Streptomyces sp. MMG1121]|uniref:hypothetical protein n=1 Tax=Streptomyces sp. MMG1121 TaxID=1415544 RepID=UPI000AAD5F6C|nr:hypothetical protein [Streptomyces sp. MMG1121]
MAVLEAAAPGSGAVGPYDGGTSSAAARPRRRSARAVHQDGRTGAARHVGAPPCPRGYPLPGPIPPSAVVLAWRARRDRDAAHRRIRDPITDTRTSLE